MPQISPTSDEVWKAYKTRVLADSLALAWQRRQIEALNPGDSLTFHVTIIQHTDKEVQEENKKLSKRVTVWKVCAAVFFFIATGHVIGVF